MEVFLLLSKKECVFHAAPNTYNSRSVEIMNVFFLTKAFIISISISEVLCMFLVSDLNFFPNYLRHCKPRGTRPDEIPINIRIVLMIVTFICRRASDQSTEI